MWNAAIVLVLIGLCLLWIMAAFNHLIRLRNQTTNAWKQIDVQLKRRHDLIPNLVLAIKGVMDFEQQTLTRVIEARNRAIMGGGVAEKAAQEAALSQALRQLFALAENYPALKSNDNVRQLQEELVSTENRIGFARQFYNDITTQFNIAQEVFPASLVARALQFQPAVLFTIDAVAERSVPAVRL